MSAYGGATRKKAYVAAAERAGHAVRPYWSSGAIEVSQYTVLMASPLNARGYLIFHLLAPFGWVCDECGQRVTPGRFRSHADRSCR